MTREDGERGRERREECVCEREGTRRRKKEKWPRARGCKGEGAGESEKEGYCFLSFCQCCCKVQCMRWGKMGCGVVKKERHGEKDRRGKLARQVQVGAVPPELGHCPSLFLCLSFSVSQSAMLTTSLALLPPCALCGWLASCPSLSCLRPSSLFLSLFSLCFFPWGGEGGTIAQNIHSIALPTVVCLAFYLPQAVVPSFLPLPTRVCDPHGAPCFDSSPSFSVWLRSNVAGQKIKVAGHKKKKKRDFQATKSSRRNAIFFYGTCAMPLKDRKRLFTFGSSFNDTQLVDEHSMMGAKKHAAGLRKRVAPFRTSG